MGLIIVLLILAAVIYKFSIIAALMVLITAIFIILRKQLTEWVPLFILAFILPCYFYHSYDFKREILPFDFKPEQSVITPVTFQDDLKVDGNLLMGTLAIKDKSYQFFYKIESEAEQHQLLRHNYSYNQCQAQTTLNHVLPNTNISGFDFDAFLYHNDKAGSLKLSNINWQDCRLVHLNLIDSVKHYRKQLALTMYNSDLSYKPFLIALTLGDTTFLNKDEMNLLKTLGIYHLYAISGSHVALISVQFYYCLRRLNIPIIFCKSLLFSILPLYMFFTGGGPSVFRATLFILLIMMNPVRKTQILDVLSITFILNLLWEPFAIYDIGFQLSYVICFSFILILPLYKEHNNIFNFFLVNFISQCATIPILFYHFNNNYFIGFISNIIYIPLFTFIIFPVCTAILIMFMLQMKINLFVDLFHLSFQLNEFVTHYFMHLSRFEYVLGAMHLSFYIVLFIALTWLFSKNKKLSVSAIAVITILMCIGFSKTNDAVHFLDVGQGDAVILELSGQTFMIDTGGKMEFSDGWEKRQNAQSISDKATIPFLKHQGIRKVNYLVLTHPDADHFGETENLIRRDLVEHIIFNPQAHGSEKYAAVIKLAKQRGLGLIDVNTLMNKHNSTSQFIAYQSPFKSGDYALQFYNAGQTGEENDDSIIVFLKGKQSQRNILFLADLSKNYEDEILSEIEEKIDIVKIGHHGSNTSTSDALLSRSPKVAIISAGRHNRYGHPHVETIEALKNHHIKIFNTQTDGRITIDLKRGTFQTQYQTLFQTK